VSKDVLFDKIAFLGIGLIGASMARVIAREGLCRSMVAYSRRGVTRSKALELGLVEAVYEEPAEAVAGADLVVIAAPIGAYASLAEAIGPTLSPGTIVTDVGSVKQAAIDAVQPYLASGVHFVPGHPIAGTEHSGPEAGFADLFEGRWTILTPALCSDEKAVEQISELWRCCGASVETMKPEHHDMVLSITSHLPHLIAYTIVGTATSLEEDLRQEVIKFSASGFRDFTRIAASDPVMWRDVFLSNKEATLAILQRFNEDLAAMQSAIEKGDGKTLLDFFSRTRDIRRGIIIANQAD